MEKQVRQADKITSSLKSQCAACVAYFGFLSSKPPFNELLLFVCFGRWDVVVARTGARSAKTSLLAHITFAVFRQKTLALSSLVACES